MYPIKKKKKVRKEEEEGLTEIKPLPKPPEKPKPKEIWFGKKKKKRIFE